MHRSIFTSLAQACKVFPSLTLEWNSQLAKVRFTLSMEIRAHRSWISEVKVNPSTVAVPLKICNGIRSESVGLEIVVLKVVKFLEARETGLPVVGKPP